MNCFAFFVAGEEGYDCVELAALAGNRHMIDTIMSQGLVTVVSTRPAGIIEYVSASVTVFLLLLRHSCIHSIANRL